jgi:hypothetical protein
MDFFSCGLRFPTVYFLRLVLESFKVQLHHLTPNGILTLSKFCYACETYGAPLDLDTFCAYYKLQWQLKKGNIDGVEVEYQFASCAFMAKRSQKDGVPKMRLMRCLSILWKDLPPQSLGYFGGVFVPSSHWRYHALVEPGF